jgi:hypothetical protein
MPRGGSTARQRPAAACSSTSERPASVTPVAGSTAADAADGNARAVSTLTDHDAVRASTQVELEGLLRGVDHQQERPVGRLPIGGLAAEGDRDGRGHSSCSSRLCHRLAVRAVPVHVVAATGDRGRAVQELSPAEDRMLAPQPAQVGDEVDERMLAAGGGPVQPADRVVLAVGVVVAGLGAAELVAAEEHRDALRQQQRREEVAALAGAQLQDARVVGRSLRAAGSP